VSQLDCLGPCTKPDSEPVALFRTDRAFASKTRVLRSDGTVEANRILMGPLSDQDRMSRRLHLADDSGPCLWTGNGCGLLSSRHWSLRSQLHQRTALQCFYLILRGTRTFWSEPSEHGRTTQFWSVLRTLEVRVEPTKRDDERSEDDGRTKVAHLSRFARPSLALAVLASLGP
jgi:hypothetical protein